MSRGRTAEVAARRIAVASNGGCGEEGEARSLAIAARGINSANDLASCMSAIISDTIEGKLTTGQANAVCNAARNLVDVVKLRCKYGTTANGAAANKDLQLVG